MPSSRKKPLAQLEHRTRIYTPSPTETRYRVVATDPVSGERIFVKCRTEDAARTKARELEQSSPWQGAAITSQPGAVTVAVPPALAAAISLPAVTRWSRNSDVSRAAGGVRRGVRVPRR